MPSSCRSEPPTPGPQTWCEPVRGATPSQLPARQEQPSVALTAQGGKAQKGHPPLQAPSGPGPCDDAAAAGASGSRTDPGPRRRLPRAQIPQAGGAVVHKAIGLLTVRWGEQGAVLAWAGGEGGVGGCRPDARPCQGLWGAVCAPGEGSGKEPRGPRSTATGGGPGAGRGAHSACSPGLDVERRVQATVLNGRRFNFGVPECEPGLMNPKL